MRFPSISVVIPSWNQGRFIKRTLLSILKQDYPGQIQIIVSDGGSTDETVEILKEFDDKITWWSEKDKGFVDAVTKGVAVAENEILAIQSSDDYYLPGAFTKMAAIFNANPKAGFVSGGECGIDLDGNFLYCNTPSGSVGPEAILFQAIPAQHSSFIRRELFEQVGGLRSEVDMCADIDLWYRASHLQPGIFIPDILSCYQLHPDQRTAVSDKWFPSLVKMVETTEQIHPYGEIFRLNDKQKKDLYAYWEMVWTAKRNANLGRSVAMKKISQTLSQSRRTNRLMIGILFPAGIKKVLKKVGFGKKELPPVVSQVNIDWWRN